MDQLVVLGRFLLAAVLGYCVGWEREYRGKPAGERTFALIALGTAVFAGISVAEFSDAAASRIVQGLVTGIGFLGAGIIFRSQRGSVQGLTTAASAWSVAAIGVLVGRGEYVLSVATTLIVIVILELNHLPMPRLRRGRKKDEGV